MELAGDDGAGERVRVAPRREVTRRDDIDVRIEEQARSVVLDNVRVIDGTGAAPMERARVIIEGESRNTAENAALSKQIAGTTAGQTWVLVTSASHMPRSVGIFCRAGWAVIAYPVDHSALKGDLLRIRWGMAGNIGNLANGIKEWVGLVAYFVTGRSSSVFPSGCSG